MTHLYVVETVEGFVRQVAAHCLPNGFCFYVSGYVREGRDPKAVDARITEKYDIAKDRWERYRRKRRGEVNLRYLRHERRFLILSTGPVGDHPFFRTEAEVRDARIVPIKFHGYEMSYRGGRTWVRIGHGELKRIRAEALDLATKRSAPALATWFRAVPCEPYAGVRYQLFQLLDQVNLMRRAAGLPRVPPWAVRDRIGSGQIFERGRQVVGSCDRNSLAFEGSGWTGT